MSKITLPRTLAEEPKKLKKVKFIATAGLDYHVYLLAIEVRKLILKC